MYIYTYVYVHNYAYMCVYAYTYTYIHHNDTSWTQTLPFKLDFELVFWKFTLFYTSLESLHIYDSISSKEPCMWSKRALYLKYKNPICEVKEPLKACICVTRLHLKILTATRIFECKRMCSLHDVFICSCFLGYRAQTQHCVVYVLCMRSCCVCVCKVKIHVYIYIYIYM